MLLNKKYSQIRFLGSRYTTNAFAAVAPREPTGGGD